MCAHFLLCIYVFPALTLFLSMKRLLLLFLVSFAISTQAQQPPFRNEIDAFRKKDSVQMPVPSTILFIGSSTFRIWKDVNDYFPGYPILNRGFGGSTLPDLIRYADEIIYPYKPRQVVIYGGDNDLAVSDSVTAQVIFNRFKTLFGMIREHLPSTNIAFVSIKPSPSRWRLEPAMVESNRLIKNFLRAQPNTAFIDIHKAMLNADGSVREDLFQGDKLHMNPAGYRLWAPIIKKSLVR